MKDQAQCQILSQRGEIDERTQGFIGDQLRIHENWYPLSRINLIRRFCGTIQERFPGSTLKPLSLATQQAKSTPKASEPVKIASRKGQRLRGRVAKWSAVFGWTTPLSRFVM